MDQFDSEYLNKKFKDNEFVDYKTVSKSRELFTAKALASAEQNGVNEIDLLTRVITRVTITDNKKREVKYAVEISLHPPGSIDNLKMFDASLITYYLNSLAGKKPEVRYITGNSAEGKYLRDLSEDQINVLYDRCMKAGKELDAKLIRNTWEVAQRQHKFEKVI